MLGLQHTWVGDLIAQVSHYDLSNNLLGSSYLFYSIGAGGAGADFDGNYYFNTDYTADIWATASLLTDNDPIPGDNYFTSDSTGARNTFSYDFGGQPLAGTWVLTLIDSADPDAGSLGTAWELSLDSGATAVPEPGYGVAVAVLAGAMLLVRRRLVRR